MIWSMYWDTRNFWKASEENGGPLSEKNLFGGPYCKIKFCNFFNNRLMADFKRCLVNKWIFTESVRYEEMLLVVVCKEISC